MSTFSKSDRRALPVSPVRQASVVIERAGPAHTPNIVGVGFTVRPAAGAVERHAPCERGRVCIRRSRPVDSRLDVDKGMASGQERTWSLYGRIHEALHLVYGWKPPALSEPDVLVDAV